MTLTADRVLHGVALIENDDSIEVGAQPFDDLTDARKLFSAFIGAQRSVGRRKDAFGQSDRHALAKARKRHRRVCVGRRLAILSSIGSVAAGDAALARMAAPYRLKNRTVAASQAS